jgi:Asp-tRNA(Asn)/Glu-tRNA(Gln) amidotransferase A subunit family amidase
VKLLYEALAHRAPEEPATRIALCPDLHVRALEPDIQRVFDHAVAAFDTLEVSFDHAGRLYPTYASIQNGEAAQTHAQLFPQRREDYGADVAARIENALRVTLAEYTEAIAERERIRAAFQRIFTVADVLLTPVAAVPPELREAPDPQGFRDGVLPYTVPQDLAGLPTCAVPVGFDDRHLPVAVQVTGPPRSEARVLTVAEALFSATASARAGSSSAP